jgi:glutathione S-transferase
MATRIAVIEAGLAVTFVEVDPQKKQVLKGGQDYFQVHPLGLVPALRTDDGQLITENVAILQYVAERAGAPLAPRDAAERTRLLQWLSFISTELHTRVFSMFFDRSVPEPSRSYALERVGARLAVLESHLGERELLLERFSVADAYLITVLNWIQVTPIDLGPYPALQRYLQRGLKRPSVKASIEIELPRYLEERRRAEAPATATS